MERLKGQLVYLSSPYTHEDSLVREVRFLEAVRATAWAINVMRVNAIGAIVHTHPILTRYDLPVEWEFWADYDTAIIKAAAEVWVLCIPGYTNSMGVTTEVKLAHEMGKPVLYMIPREPGHYILMDADPGEENLYGKIEPGRLGHPPFKAGEPDGNARTNSASS